jgi:proteic killer suppression protein
LRLPVADVTLNVTANKNFKDERTAALFRGEFVKAFSGFDRRALNRLDQLENAKVLADLASVRGNRLEALKGARKGQFSIRINDQYRVCFRWEKGYAIDVEIADYH